MLCARPSPRRRLPHPQGPPRRGFTLVELLVVIVILAILIALLLPVINGALRTARNTAVGAEINQLAQALTSFKTKYGDFPPSRILLCEDGNYGPYMGTGPVYSVDLPGDITIGQLAQRSLSAMRKFFPKVQFSTAGIPSGIGPSRWYDFNGNGTLDAPYVLQGHECLVFFLGGIPMPTDTGFSMTGFGKDPTNPFTNSIQIQGNTMYSANRTAPMFEFATNRLVEDPWRETYPKYRYPILLLRPADFPGYLDSLGNALGTVDGRGPMNFYAYFSSYGNNGYDPNDMNIPERDASNTTVSLGYQVGFPLYNRQTTGVSWSPNPYTASTTNPTTGTVTYHNAQTFQIISSGVDGLYGVGGQYSSDSTASPLPVDLTTTFAVWPPKNSQDATVRTREHDNITNFHNGRLD